MDHTLLCFDASDQDSLDFVMDLYSHPSLAELRESGLTVVALRMERVPPEDMDELERRRFGASREVHQRAVNWCQVQNLDLFEVSTEQNVGVRELFQHISSAPS